MKSFCSTTMIAVFLLFCINGIQAQNKSNHKDLMAALKAEDLTNSLILVQNIDDVNYKEKEYSLLYRASSCGYLEVVAYSCDSGHLILV